MSFYARWLAREIPSLVGLTLFTGFFGVLLIGVLGLMGFNSFAFAQRHVEAVLLWAATMTVTTMISAVDEPKKSWMAQKDELRG